MCFSVNGANEWVSVNGCVTVGERICVCLKQKKDLYIPGTFYQERMGIFEVSNFLNFCVKEFMDLHSFIAVGI